MGVGLSPSLETQGPTLSAKVDFFLLRFPPDSKFCEDSNVYDED